MKFNTCLKMQSSTLWMVSFALKKLLLISSKVLEMQTFFYFEHTIWTESFPCALSKHVPPRCKRTDHQFIRSIRDDLEATSRDDLEAAGRVAIPGVGLLEWKPCRSFTQCITIHPRQLGELQDNILTQWASRPQSGCVWCLGFEGSNLAILLTLP